MTLVRCEACGWEFEFPYGPAVLDTVRRCGHCGRPSLVVVALDEHERAEDQPAIVEPQR